MLNNYELFNISDVGRKREKNEDYYATYQNKQWLLMILCDGMGGVKGGQVASRLAVKAIGEYFKKKFEEPVSFFQKAVAVANKAIKRKAHTHPELAQMGTTLVALLYNGSEVYYAHVGDSRLYLLRNGVLKQLTTDHSYVNEMVKRGLIKPEEANTHQLKNRITRCIGLLESEPEICAAPLKVQEGDTFLLCSDGLTDMVPVENIRKILTGSTSIEKAGADLIDEANRNGGRDNITIQLLRVTANPVNGVRLNGAANSSKPSSNSHNFIFILPVVLILLALIFWFFSLSDLTKMFNIFSPSDEIIHSQNEAPPTVNQHFSSLKINSKRLLFGPQLPPESYLASSIVKTDSVYNYFIERGKTILNYPVGDTLVKIVSLGKPPLPQLKGRRLKEACSSLSLISIYPIRADRDTIYMALVPKNAVPDTLLPPDAVITGMFPRHSSEIWPTDTIKVVLEGSQFAAGADSTHRDSTRENSNEDHL